jgi:hypothetical protein
MVTVLGQTSPSFETLLQQLKPMNRPQVDQGVSFIPEKGMDSIPDLLEGVLPRVDRLPPAAWIPHRLSSEAPFLWRHWVVSNENSRNNSWTIQKIGGIILILPLLSTSKPWFHLPVRCAACGNHCVPGPYRNAQTSNLICRRTNTR